MLLMSCGLDSPLAQSQISASHRESGTAKKPFLMITTGVGTAKKPILMTTTGVGTAKKPFLMGTEGSGAAK